MAKRVDHDSTMEVSSSQLVPDAKKRPAPHRAPGVDKNDVSMWIGNVVGADDFAGKKAAPKRRWGLVLLVVLLVAAAGGAAYYVLVYSKQSTPTPSAASPADAAIAPLTLDAAAPVATPVDAGVDVPSAVIDAGTGALQADAITGVDANKPPVKKPTKKVVKKVVKKPVPKKPVPKKK